MDHYERAKLSDAIKEQKFNPGDYIIKEVSKFLIHSFQGELGHVFYMIVDGEAIATKTLARGQ